MLSIGHQIVFRFHLLLFGVFESSNPLFEILWDVTIKGAPRIINYSNQSGKSLWLPDYQVVGFRGDEEGSSTYTRLAPEQGEPREWLEQVETVDVSGGFEFKNGFWGKIWKLMMMMILIMRNPRSFKWIIWTSHDLTSERALKENPSWMAWHFKLDLWMYSNNIVLICAHLFVCLIW